MMGEVSKRGREIPKAAVILSRRRKGARAAVAPFVSRAARGVPSSGRIVFRSGSQILH